MDPLITVVVPVYERVHELRRALTSVQEQTYESFECIVVDDASTAPIAEVVAELGDERFRYHRQAENGGPTSARLAAFRAMKGEIAVGLDSDQAAYPWMLARIVHHLDASPEVDGVAGMFVRMSDGRLLVDVERGSKVMTPAEYVDEPPVPDCVGAIRRNVVEEWLEKRSDYFALELHQWFTFHMRHNQLFVDEPWARLYVDAANRVSQRSDDRILDDYVKFLDEHEQELQETKAAVLDSVAADAWFALKRAGREADASRFAAVMERRGLSRTRTVAERLAGKARRVLVRRGEAAPYRLR